MPNYYRVGYGSPEDSYYLTLCSDVAYTQDDLHGIVLKAFVAVFKAMEAKAVADYKKWAKRDPEWKDAKPHIGVAEVVSSIEFKAALAELGLPSVDCRERFTLCGWAHVRPNTEHGFRDDPEDVAFLDEVCRLAGEMPQ